MGYIGQAPTKATTSITSADILNGTIALSDMASQSVDEDNLHISNSGSNGNFLSKQSGDAGGLTWAAAGGAWTLIGTSVATGVAALSQTGLSSTYDTYVVVGSDLVGAGDGNGWGLQVGDSSGYDTAGSDYSYHRQTLQSNASTYGGGNSTGDDHLRISGGVGNAAGEGLSFIAYIGKPSDGTTQPLIYGNHINLTCGGTIMGGTFIGNRTAVITIDRVQLIVDGGSNINTGRMSVYGISHA